MDYGLRISYNGLDVKTCSDLDCVVTSKYSNLKGTISGTVATSNNGNQKTTTTIAHNLGYIPFAKALSNDSGFPDWYQVPYSIFGLGAYYKLYLKCDSTNLYIIEDSSGNSADNVTFKYFIFIDKGKL